jgi:hypothetical protein
LRAPPHWFSFFIWPSRARPSDKAVIRFIKRAGPDRVLDTLDRLTVADAGGVGPMTERMRVYRYCRFADLPGALRLGWMVADDFGATHHSAYAVMVVWLCDCEPRWVR